MFESDEKRFDNGSLSKRLKKKSKILKSSIESLDQKKWTEK